LTSLVTEIKPNFLFFPSSSIQGNLGIVMGAALASAK
jgi:hypothetical protein